MNVHAEFVFGLGLGLFFAGLLAASTPSISDDEIERRARELGMVKQDEVFAFDMGSKGSASPTETENKKSVASPINPGPSAADNKDKEKTSSAKKPPVQKKSVPVVNKSGGNAETISFTVVSGSTLDEVAEQLENKGIIESKAEFRELVKSKNLSNKLVADTYELQENEDMEKLIRILCGWEGSEN